MEDTMTRTMIAVLVIIGLAGLPVYYREYESKKREDTIIKRQGKTT
jgi:hypothetical protein